MSPKEIDGSEIRRRILDAAFSCFMKSGYAASSMLQIATQARVSKRDLYQTVGNKEEMLVACISARAERLRLPLDVPVAQDRDSLDKLLTALGARMLREITDPTVIAVFRLAIAEAVHAPEVAQALDSIGRDASRTALKQVMVNAKAAGLVAGEPSALADRFGGLLWGNLMVSLLLGVGTRPTATQAQHRARDAAAALLQLYSTPLHVARG